MSQSISLIVFKKRDDISGHIGKTSQSGYMYWTLLSTIYFLLSPVYHISF